MAVVCFYHVPLHRPFGLLFHLNRWCFFLFRSRWRISSRWKLQREKRQSKIDEKSIETRHTHTKIIKRWIWYRNPFGSHNIFMCVKRAAASRSSKCLWILFFCYHVSLFRERVHIKSWSMFKRLMCIFIDVQIKVSLDAVFVGRKSMCPHSWQKIYVLTWKEVLLNVNFNKQHNEKKRAWSESKE